MKGGLGRGWGGRRRSEGEVREIEGAETMSINHMSVWIITTSLSNPLPTIFLFGTYTFLISILIRRCFTGQQLGKV